MARANTCTLELCQLNRAMRERSFDLALRARNQPIFEGLDRVARFQVLEIGQADTALEARRDLTHVVLEPPQRSHLALPNHRALTQEAHLPTAGDRPIP